jgi:hypothetical protein
LVGSRWETHKGIASCAACGWSGCKNCQGNHLLQTRWRYDGTSISKSDTLGTKGITGKILFGLFDVISGHLRRNGTSRGAKFKLAENLNGYWASSKFGENT